MRLQTRQAYNAFLTQVAQLNGVPSAAEKFTVSPSVQQRLEQRIQESSAFLQQINVIGVDEQSGQTLRLGVGAPVAGTTDTTSAERQTTDPTGMDPYDYFCSQTNFDTHVDYNKLDAWAKFPDFQTRLRDNILAQQGRDRMMIGFNGTSRAATSDRATNPLLQDVNIGWLQKYRATAAARVMAEVKADSGVVKVGPAVAAVDGYANLDALVFDAVNNLVDPWWREDTQLVCILGRDLMADKYFPLINQPQKPIDMMALDTIVSQKRVGGLQAVRVPYFPSGALMVTRLDNMSIYYQIGSRRRTILDKASRDRIENYESSNEAYVIEDYGCGCVVENIEIVVPA